MGQREGRREQTSHEYFSLHSKLEQFLMCQSILKIKERGKCLENRINCVIKHGARQEGTTAKVSTWKRFYVSNKQI